MAAISLLRLVKNAQVVQRVEDTLLPEGHHLDDDRHQDERPEPKPVEGTTARGDSVTPQA